VVFWGCYGLFGKANKNGEFRRQMTENRKKGEKKI